MPQTSKTTSDSAVLGDPVTDLSKLNIFGSHSQFLFSASRRQWRISVMSPHSSVGSKLLKLSIMCIVSTVVPRTSGRVLSRNMSVRFAVVYGSLR